GFLLIISKLKNCHAVLLPYRERIAAIIAKE
ncbi:MAG: hypothetical protein ACI9YP_001658, partial [Colwellia sp.]